MKEKILNFDRKYSDVLIAMETMCNILNKLSEKDNKNVYHYIDGNTVYKSTIQEYLTEYIQTLEDGKNRTQKLLDNVQKIIAARPIITSDNKNKIIYIPSEKGLNPQRFKKNISDELLINMFNNKIENARRYKKQYVECIIEYQQEIAEAKNWLKNAENGEFWERL